MEAVHEFWEFVYFELQGRGYYDAAIRKMV